MTKDPDRELLRAWLADKNMLRTEAYAKGGRHFSDLDNEELERRWVAALKEWVTNFNTRMEHPDRHDLESEFALRRKMPPFQRVTEEFAALLDASHAVLAKLTPEALVNADRKLEDKFEAFRELIKKTSSN